MSLLKKTTLAACTLLLCGLPGAVARPAYPHPIVCTQSDGTQITVRIVGDESYHYVLSQDGYSLAAGPDGDYYYARLSEEGCLVPTSVKARPYASLSLAERKQLESIRRGLKPTGRALENRTRMRKAFAPELRTDASGDPVAPVRISSAQTTGKLRSLVILVETSDKSFSVSSPQSAFSDLLNQHGYAENGATGSAWDYYNENSGGRFDPDFVVVGPFKVSNTASYYAGSDGTKRVPEMIVEACEAADNAGVDFSEFSDNGVIRDIFVFYAGYNQAEGANFTIWPHRYDVWGDKIEAWFDGNQLRGYACTSELKDNKGKKMTGIGAFCHEFGHVLGWPDFYDTDGGSYGNEAPGFEDYSLMCSGSYNNDSRTPPALNILERWMVGWVEPEELKISGDYTLAPVWKDAGYLIRTDNDNEYFLLENHASGESPWDEYLVDYVGMQGMLVYHIDNTAGKSDYWEVGSPNMNANHECARIVRSKPGKNAEYEPSMTFFPGSYNCTTLSSSNSDYVPWYGGDAAATLSEIRLEGQNALFNVKAKNAGVAFDCTVAAYQFDALLRWEEGTTQRCKVEWKSGGKTVGSIETEGSVVHIDGLTPATEYTVELTPEGGTYAGRTLQKTFLTERVPDTARNAYIALTGETYDASKPVLLSLRNYTGRLGKITWSIDGTDTKDTYPTLSTGEHCITAAVTDTDGTVEYIMKYITVK